MFVFKILAFSHQNAAIILLKNDALNANYRHQSYSALHNILINILRVLYITANLHCKSRNLPYRCWQIQYRFAVISEAPSTSIEMVTWHWRTHTGRSDRGRARPAAPAPLPETDRQANKGISVNAYLESLRMRP